MLPSSARGPESTHRDPQYKVAASEDALQPGAQARDPDASDFGRGRAVPGSAGSEVAPAGDADGGQAPVVGRRRRQVSRTWPDEDQRVGRAHSDRPGPTEAEPAQIAAERERTLRHLAAFAVRLERMVNDAAARGGAPDHRGRVAPALGRPVGAAGQDTAPVRPTPRRVAVQVPPAVAEEVLEVDALHVPVLQRRLGTTTTLLRDVKERALAQLSGALTDRERAVLGAQLLNFLFLEPDPQMIQIYLDHPGTVSSCHPSAAFFFNLLKAEPGQRLRAADTPDLGTQLQHRLASEAGPVIAWVRISRGGQTGDGHSFLLAVNPDSEEVECIEGWAGAAGGSPIDRSIERPRTFALSDVRGILKHLDRRPDGSKQPLAHFCALSGAMFGRSAGEGRFLVDRARTLAAFGDAFGASDEAPAHVEVHVAKMLPPQDAYRRVEERAAQTLTAIRNRAGPSSGARPFDRRANGPR